MRRLLLNLALLGTSSAAFAWGAVGHAAVAELAGRRLTPQAAATVAQVLEPGQRMASVASWPDEIRADPQATPEVRATGLWHFVRIPGSAAVYDAGQHCGPPNQPQACVVGQLERLRNDLRCAPTPQARREALMWAIHLVGDLHQPLHAYDDLRGGNDMPVVLRAQGPHCGPGCEPWPERTNLHAAWDYGLLGKLVSDHAALVARIEDGWMRTSEAQAPNLDGGTPVAWANASHALGAQVWRMTQDTQVLDDDYLRQAEPIVMRQIGLAGLRLARFLNEAYASGACPRR